MSADPASGLKLIAAARRVARFIVSTLLFKSLARVLVAFAIIAAVTVVTASTAWTQVRAPGGITVKDDLHCPTQPPGTAAKVTVPFSVFITGLIPNSTDAQLRVTDKDASPEIEYGPFTIRRVNAAGEACINVRRAPPGNWKIDVFEQGNGFTDSKVITVVAPEEPTTTTTTTTTTPPPPTTTTSTSTTTVPGETTTTPPPTTTPTPTTAPPATTPTTVPAVIDRPGSDLPWVFDYETVPESAGASTLPRTGTDGLRTIVIAGVLIAAGLPLLRARRRR